MHFSKHVSVAPLKYFPTSLCGVLVLVLHPVRLLPSPPVASLTHNLLTHNFPAQLVNTQLVNTQLVYTQLDIDAHFADNLSSHNLLTHNLSSHNLLTHNLLSHKLLTHNISTHTHTPCPHTTWHRRSLCVGNLSSHNLLTHNLSSHKLLTHNLSSHNLLTQNWLSHNLLTHNLLSHKLLTHNFSTYTRAHTLSSHNLTSTLTLRGRRGTYGTGPALVTRRVPKWRRGRRGFLRGRRGTWWHRLSLCVASVALGDLDFHFAWHAWHLVTSTVTLRGRPGTHTQLVITQLAHTELLHIHTHKHTICSRTTWHRCSLCTCTHTHTPCPHTTWHRRSLCVAGVALGHIDRPFAWQAWHLATWAFFLRGRCGAWRHVSLLGDIDAHLAWQACHLRHWVGSGDAPGSQMTPWPPRVFAWQAWHLVTSHRLSLCVAGVAFGDMDLHFAWQVWHLATSIFTWWHRCSLCVACVALTALGRLWWHAGLWRRGRRGSLHGRRGTWWLQLPVRVLPWGQIAGS